LVIEEEKKDRRAFLDEDIEQIDNNYANDDRNDYSPKDSYSHHAKI
jgi:recombinational DNA repair ATPase RecF